MSSQVSWLHPLNYALGIGLNIVDNLLKFLAIDFSFNFYQLYPNLPCCNVLAIYNVGSFFTENWIRGTSHPGLEVAIFPEFIFSFIIKEQSQQSKFITRSTYSPHNWLIVKRIQAAPKTSIAWTNVAGDRGGLQGQDGQQSEERCVYRS